MTHIKHDAHVCDAGRVETQRLVERRRSLPSGEGHGRRGAGKETGGGEGRSRRKRCAGEGPRLDIERIMARAVRTANMKLMSVTLDVLRLSGWLNTDASCRVERVAYEERCEQEDGRGVGRRRRTRAVCRGTAQLDTGRNARAEQRTKSMMYVLVTLDVSKLSGWLNDDAFCQVERRAYTMGRGASKETGRC